MTDIVERLRGHDERTGGDDGSIWAEAADEIERLRGHKEEADRHIKTIAQLRDEIEQLKHGVSR